MALAAVSRVTDWTAIEDHRSSSPWAFAWLPGMEGITLESALQGRQGGVIQRLGPSSPGVLVRGGTLVGEGDVLKAGIY